MKENITQTETKEKNVKNTSETAAPKQSTLDFIMQFARVCRPAASMSGALNVMTLN
ncbi:MAG: hypothetical protein K2O00_00865 [Muribaculaceae bacterium]|nr:hypothetical protein [Muribaculaceae bacterium]